MELYPKDFIETWQGLLFAVVEREPEDHRVLCFLRYLRTKTAILKFTTNQANRFLQDNFPSILYYSKNRDTYLHGVCLDGIKKIHRARHGLITLKNSSRLDNLEAKAVGLVETFQENALSSEFIGVTGSLLLGAHNSRSDIDLVIYGRDNFLRARRIIQNLMESGIFQVLSDKLWKDAYDRRGTCLSLNEYIWHERRKFNKAAFRGTKFDLSFIGGKSDDIRQSFRKLRFSSIKAVVTDDRYSFDYPARFALDHREIPEAVSFTPTYAGQAVAGERVEISGFVEETANGSRRIVVGSSREAGSEYIKVLNRG